MPLYVYACRNCGETLEHMQSFSADPLTECEKCGGDLERVLQPAGIIFRGSGFYTTDYGRSSNGGDGKHEGSTETASAVSESTSTAGSTSEKKEAGAGASTTVGSAASSS